MEFAVIQLPAAAVRRRPRHSSEMVNQLLFGEMVVILRQKNDRWARIRSVHDHYEGWTSTAFLQPLREDEALRGNSVATNALFSELQMGDKRLHIPFGSSLPAFESGEGRINETTYRLHSGYYDTAGAAASVEKLKELAQQWLHVPYLWGGRTPMGVDCSGLVQILFKMIGIPLPRDAWQQAQAGEAVRKFRDARPGDLLFFDEKEEIVHVGILFEPGIMIHSSGKVGFDEVDKKGLVGPRHRSRKLRLRAIRRLFV